MTALGYLSATERGETDRLLARIAATLQAEGWRVAGVVQHNIDCAGRSHCDMDLQVLGGAADTPERVRISQSLGEGSTGCRLDPQGLAIAVGLVEPHLDRAPHLMIVNKFGKAEIEGGGFRALIAEALAREIPVLVGLKALNRDGFSAFAEDLAQPVPGALEPALAWCRAAMQPRS